MNMNRVLLSICCCLIFAVVPVMAAENTIPPSGTVFLGEEGLDISATGVTANTNIVWYGTGGTIGSVPSATVFVTDPASFYVSPAIFSGKTGPWFTESANNLAFYVEEPQISIRVFDITSGFEITPTTVWVPKGDTIGFQVDNNVYVLASRPGSPGAPITIKIQGPNGIQYSSVDSFRLADILIFSPTYMTGPVWYTGTYEDGNYTVWAESTGNGMKDNYPQVGQTISRKVTFLMQSTNPLITPSTVGTTLPTTLPTTVTTTQTPTPTSTLTFPPTTPTSTLTLLPTTPTTTPPTTAPGFGAIIVLFSLGAIVLMYRWKN
jgi:hypothetical protein